MKTFFLILFCFGCFSINIAQVLPSLDVSLIPDSLKVNANSVIRWQNIKLDITENGKATLQTNEAITVLNEEGEDALLFMDYEDGFRKIKDVVIYLYDAKGNLIEKFKKKQLEKVAHNDGFSLINDGKLFYFSVPASSFPITVVFDSEVQLKSFLDFDDLALSYMEQSIQEVNYTIKSPITNPIKFKNSNALISPTITTENGYNLYAWNAKNKKAIKGESNSGSRNVLPRVLITPTFFEMDGNKGSFASWKDYGNWYYSLCSTSNDIKENDKTAIIDIANKATSDKEKVKVLYSYLQQNYRYVSIQLGIGGFKPFATSFVYKNKYGDCKALSNYMQSMLQLVGIESYQALINAGNKQMPVDTDFPNHSFNHVILCVPNKGDTIWLECTSNTSPFGILGNFTENRNALLITPDGGILVATPKSKASDNFITTQNKITINDDFSAKGVFEFKHSGEFYDAYVNELWLQNQQDQNEFLVDYLGFKPFETFSIQKQKEATQSSTKMDIDFNKIHEFNAGSKYFLRQHLFTVWKTPMPINKDRQTDYFFSFPFEEHDTTIYVLPNGFTIDNLPKKINLKSDYAVFNNEVSYNASDNTINVITSLILLNQRIPASKYWETKIFFDKVITECNQRIVIKKQ